MSVGHPLQIPVVICCFETWPLPLGDLPQLPGCWLIQGDYGQEQQSVLSSSPGIQNPQVTAACGSWWGWHGPRATGQNGGAPAFAKLSTSCPSLPGPICWWWCHGSVDIASIFRADGVLMELASSWMRFAVSLPALQAKLPGRVCSALTHAWRRQPESLPGNSGGAQQPALLPVISVSQARSTSCAWLWCGVELACAS